MEIALQGRAPRGWDHQLWRLMLTVSIPALLSFGIPASEAQLTIRPDPASPFVGGEVVLKVVTYSPLGKMNSVNWYRAKDDGRVQSNVIVTLIPNSRETPGAKTTGRESVLPDGSLKIINLVASDMGDYTVEIIVAAGPLTGTLHLMVAATPPPNATLEPSRSTAPTTARPPASGDSPRETTSQVGVIIGAVIGVLVGAALVTLAAVLLYKRHHNSKKKGDRIQPVTPPRTALPNRSASVTSDGYLNPDEIKSRPHAYETVLPTLPMDQTSPPSDGVHVYEELQYADQNVYNRLQK